MSSLDGRALDLKSAGNRAAAKRDLKAAEDAFRELIEVVPESAEGYLGLAKTLERAHPHEEIVALLEPVVEGLQTPGIIMPSTTTRIEWELAVKQARVRAGQ